MSIRSFATIYLAVACILISLAPETQAGTCSILQVRGANGKNGVGFGVQPDDVVPRTGGGDTGADAAEFQAGPNPNPVCGVVPILPSRVVDISSFVSQAVDAGIPSVFSNGSIPLTVFQINRIGGGPMTCEYSSDATGNSWQPMDMTLNMAGNFGIDSQQNTKMTVVTTLRAGSKFTGGATKDLGLVRCRAGTDGNCGGCFVVQMSGQVMDATNGDVAASPVNSAPLQLTSQQMSSVVAKVIDMAKSQNLVAPASKR
ncbi:hypothetical protein MJO28_006229 [Puccinia striiformis f. sp. tritici]|uniref:Secreted protein n=4 Tax=Puccinia striiformis TaxID=27350 RepID=A0A0L0VL19_9BASI|nr:hypothetical protein Pst134EA_011427 [Puccinia striiformis f. sp. tritici]KNE99957.1 hypothetical protein PSTG_06809 [Puccinia striiformis f. sp. tritici PST-78]POV97217.1 hypothetical protein PSTT_15166 [Puccinia striiformis]KAH9456204.1 hypothetical protein Pst134EB_012408 [Puccinia striiformis f. sp. tritici]KAH9467801.1 hypothetical protein Pst134EA_011427 [Puccinia striiformis f. sp. tritici]KAI7953682.1 hypothetical protein MJO28_006229 [Puccinia striiformis f. sp. tritici]